MRSRLHTYLRSRFSQVLAVLLAVSLAVLSPLSAHTIEELHDHDCTGEHCLACQVMGVAKALLNTGAMAATVRSCLVGLVLVCAAVVMVRRLMRSAETPVTLGVRLAI